jgi:hypothetical protein
MINIVVAIRQLAGGIGSATVGPSRPAGANFAIPVLMRQVVTTGIDALIDGLVNAAIL